MKKITLLFVVCVMALTMSSATFAAISDFVGYWRNVNPNTGGVTAIYILKCGNNIYVYAWGKCHPSDCYWGGVRGTAYAPSVSDDLDLTAQAITALFQPSFAEKLMIIHSLDGNFLQAEVMTRFTDGSGRTNYNAVYTFTKSRSLSKPDILALDNENESNLNYDALTDENLCTENALPAGFELDQNYPNPFNPETEIQFKIPEAKHVTLKIYNALGQEIRTLVDASHEAGSFTVRWNGKDKQGNQVSSGLYFYHIKAGNFSAMKKMSLIQ